MINPVSADSLRKTGIFADKAGDFRRFPPRDRKTGSLETKLKARKAGISGPFSRLLGSLAERTNALAGAGGIEPPNGGIKIRLIIQRFQDAFGKNVKNALLPFQQLGRRFQIRSDPRGGGSVSQHLATGCARAGREATLR